ncbi:MAG: precorrin-8X methylmutase [Gemmataceae bacterium]
MTPEEILAESFRRIEEAVGPHPFTGEEWPIVRRMIHASGDLEIIKHISFTAGAAAAGIDALRAGRPLVTDVQMVATGIARPLLDALEIPLHCYIDDPEVTQQARATGQTRSLLAMQKAIRIAGDAIYAIGNAPTALLALCAAIRAGQVQPRLILALPVGFVSVIESKEEALALDVPVLALRGRKGGSGMTAAAINAMLLLARDQER